MKNVIQAVTAGLVTAALVIFFSSPQPAAQPSVEIITAAGAELPRASGPVSYADAVKVAAPAVVNINTEKTVTVRSHPFFSDPVFKQFFGDMLLGGSPQARKRVENSLGSGVIISPQGYILTNNHVIQGADAIKVSLRDGRDSEAKVIGTDPETDIALLKIDLSDLPAVTIGDSEQLQIGDVVLAIGNPYGVGQTVTMGIVSATGRSQLGINTFENFIQTDAAINPGNSGGALIDAHGRLIGINTAIFSRSGGSQGIGFAIPSNMARNVMTDLIEHGQTIRGWLGFEGHELNEKLAESLGLDSAEGIIITGIVRNSPAHDAGLEPGDIIVEIEGQKVKTAKDALLTITRKRPGEEVSLKVVRDRKLFAVSAVTINRPSEAPGGLN
jgi:serine protease DegS